MRFAIFAIWAVSIAIVASALPARADSNTVRCVLETPSCGWVIAAPADHAAPADAR